jgi:hypothetical protein
MATSAAIHQPLELARDTFPFGGMPMKSIKLVIAAYVALIATVFAAGVVVFSVHDMRESRVNALHNAYLAAP